MLKNCEWSLDRDYKKGSENEPWQFYLDGLTNSNEFSLLLGYFSSSAINLLSVGFATFIGRGGKIKMVINHLLSPRDKEALINASSESSNTIFDLTDVASLRQVLNEYDKHFFECLAYLISEKRIEIKVIKPKNGEGIAHYKSGVFYDGQDAVGYTASCNFTLYGLSKNLETLEAFLSWENGRSNKLINKLTRLIDDYFSEADKDVDYINVNEIEVSLKDTFGGKDIDELLVQEELLLKEKLKLTSNPRLKKTLENLHIDLEIHQKIPRFPWSEGPRPYQKIAYDKWMLNNFKGMFAMATGTGKTITSLNCLFEIYKETGSYKTLILVPTMSLVEQWVKECIKFNFKDNIVKVYSLNNWQSELSRLETLKLLKKESSFVIIATYASFVTTRFQRCLAELPEETLLIADECHNMGSSSVMKTLQSINFNKRIGLSATPERQYQEDINSTLRNFFCESIENEYVFSYTMEEAIKNEPKALSPYRYYPVIVRLTDSEFRKYVDFTKRINTMRPKDDEEREIFNRLCIARQRVIHKAENKLDAFKSILKEEYGKRNNLKFTLVYVPEGLADEDVVFDPMKNDVNLETDSDRNLLNRYTMTIAQLFDNVTVKQFIGSTLSDDRKKIINDFADGTLQVITSMKCLDEGIDIPRAEMAIFCASTGNPRQFIQRRGRVLRLAKGKEEAVIYDLVVVPDPCGDESLFRIEQGEVAKELRRIRDFSEMSENKHFTRELLDPILNYYQLTL